MINGEDAELRKQFMCLYNLERISSTMKSQFGWYLETKGYKRYLDIKKASFSLDEAGTIITKECETAIHEISGVLEENMSSYNIKLMLFTQTPKIPYFYITVKFCLLLPLF